MRDATLQRIREAILNGHYNLTDHALEELDADRLTYIDVESAILTGKIVRRQADQLSPERYTIHGLAADLNTRMAIVCRFVQSTDVLIITVYELHDR